MRMNIAVLHHPNTDMARPVHLVWHLARHWVRQGHAVMHYRKVGAQLLAADVVFLHIDLTVLPPAYVELLQDHPCVINRKVTDISKTLFSAARLHPHDDYAGQAIIKTVSNYGGKPESRQQALQKGAAGAPFDWASTTWLDHYPIAPSLAQVPAGVWQNPHLMVEKFLPEQQADGLYRVREWVFLGRRNVHYMNLAREPVIKSHNTIDRVMLPEAEIPEQLQDIRQRMHMDYGKFDFVIHDGEVVLYDINKTMGGPASAVENPQLQESIAHLALGIEDFAKEAL